MLIPKKREIVAETLRTTGLLALFERVALRPCVLILCYHRIAELGENPLYDPIDSASSAAFESQVRFLRNHFALPGPESWTEWLASGTPVTEPTAILTFDDGYHDNFERAFPILKALDTTATFFLPTDFLEGPRLFWWDLVAYVLKRTRVDRLSLERPEILEVDLRGQPRSRALMAVIAAFLRADRPEDPDVLDHLADRAEVDLHIPTLAARLFMNWDQVLTLRRAGMGIGSHTRSHPNLARLTEADQVEELVESRRLLETRLGQPVTTLAYPFGGRGDFTAATKDVARHAGYRLAFALRRAVTPQKDLDPFDIPRVPVSSSESFSLFRSRVDLLGALGESPL